MSAEDPDGIWMAGRAARRADVGVAANARLTASNAVVLLVLAPRDWLRRTRRDVTGAARRQWLIAASLVAGCMLGFLLLSQVGHWLAVRPGGIVYAVDIDQALLDHIAEAATEQGVGNVQTVLGEYDNPDLPAEVDLAFINEVLHHIEHRAEYLKNLAA